MSDFNDRDDPIEIAGTVRIVTDKAVGLQIDDDDDEDLTWIPKSQIGSGDDPDSVEKGDQVTFEIPTWLAEEKGLA